MINSLIPHSSSVNLNTYDFNTQKLMSETSLYLIFQCLIWENLHKIITCYYQTTFLVSHLRHIFQTKLPGQKGKLPPNPWIRQAANICQHLLTITA